jgi:hypothetical protein
MKKKRNHIILLLITILSALLISCDEAALDVLTSSSLEVHLKGSLESNGAPIALDDPETNGESHTGDFDITYANLTAPTTLMLDIAEIRLVDSAGGVVKFANNRVVFTAALDGSDTNGELFFGVGGTTGAEGVTVTTDEVVPGITYVTAQVFIRKLGFDNAQKTVRSSVSWETSTFTFHETTTNGFDINQLLPNTAYDRHKENADYINRVFPLSVPIAGGFVFDPAAGKNVLEIRIVMRNLLEAYEYDYVYSDTPYVAHFWGISDWLRTVRMDYDEPYIGGNLLGAARGYVEGTGSGTVDVSGAPFSDPWVVVIPSSEDISDYVKSGSASRVAAVNDIPVNPYIHMNNVLDYCLAFEGWRITNAGSFDQDTFKTAWTTYESAASEMKIPPYIVYKAGGTNTITNVPPGTYKAYRVTGASVKALLTSGSYTQVGSTFTVTAGGTVTP